MAQKVHTTFILEIFKQIEDSWTFGDFINTILTCSSKSPLWNIRGKLAGVASDIFLACASEDNALPSAISVVAHAARGNDATKHTILKERVPLMLEPLANTDWLGNLAARLCTNVMKKEIAGLCSVKSGLHGNAQNATGSSTMEFNMSSLQEKYKKESPTCWNAIRALMDATDSWKAQDTAQKAGMRGLQRGLNLQKKKSPSARTPAPLRPLPEDVWVDTDTESESSDSDCDTSDSESDLDASPFELLPGERRSNKRRLRDPKKTASEKRDLKTAAAISQIIHASNQRANLYQCCLGMHLLACGASDDVVTVLANGGFCISLSTIRRMRDSLSAAMLLVIQSLCMLNIVQIIYDNLNIALRSSESTLLQDSTFHNMTAATFLTTYFPSGTAVDDLKVTEKLWSTSLLNPHPAPEIEDIPANPTYFDLVKAVAAESGCSPYDSIQQDLISQIERILVESEECMTHLKPALQSSRRAVKKLTLRKTEPIPAIAIDEDEGTLNGNLAVIRELRRQGDYKPDQADYVTFMHVDLATFDFIATLQRSTRLEETSFESKLAYIVTIPGLFHTLAAMGDAIVKIHVSGQPRSELPGSFFNLAAMINPRTVSQFHNRPGFRMVQRTTYIMATASIRDCAEQVLGKSLTKWYKSKPDLDRTRELATDIYERLVGGSDSTKEDSVALANQKLLNLHLLLYMASHQAIRSGDIGRFIHLLLAWIPIFKATGKYRYAEGMFGFLCNLYFRWPKKFAEIIRHNWLLNLTGLENQWMGLDMVQEQHNGKHKRSAGRGSNKSIRNIIVNSSLIRFYTKASYVVSKNFKNYRNTRKHKVPNASALVKLVQNQIRKFGLHDESGRSTRVDHYRVMDAIQEGCTTLAKVAPAKPPLHGLKEGDIVMDGQPGRAEPVVQVKIETE